MYLICYCFTQGYTRNSAQRKRGILSEIETAIKKSAWSWNQRQSSTKWGKICAEVSYEAWRIQQSLLTGRSLPSIPRELLYLVNSVIQALLSAFSHTNIRLWKKIIKPKKRSSCRLNCFFNSEHGLQKKPNFNFGEPFCPQWKKLE